MVATGVEDGWTRPLREGGQDSGRGDHLIFLHEAVPAILVLQDQVAPSSCLGFP